MVVATVVAVGPVQREHLARRQGQRDRPAEERALEVAIERPGWLDYNTDFKTAAQQSGLYAPDAYRTSDHDPVLVGLELYTPSEAPKPPKGR